MKKQIKIKFLGTGANGGIPQIDCRCVNCSSLVNTRKRSSLLVEINGRKIIVDAGPDLHSQLIENNLRLQDISGIIISHLHWDHSAGLVELSSGKALGIPIFVHSKLKKSLKQNNALSFIFKRGWAKFSPIKGVNVKFIEIDHDPNFTTFAISLSNDNKKILIATDIRKINRKFSREAKKADLVIFDATFLTKSKHWHISIQESAALLRQLNENVIFTHINHSENKSDVENFLKGFGFRLAFDGLEIKI